MDRVHVIRHKHFNEGHGIRRIARELSLSRNTVRKYLDQSEPRRRESGPRRRPGLEQVSKRIVQLLEEWGPRTTVKQRITGTRIHQQLIEEGYQVGSTTVREYLAEKRRQRQEVFVPLVWRAGDAAQVDFFEVTVDVGGERRKAWKFVMRLMYSGRDFVWLYERCNQVSFLDGHVRAFAHFGGVPARWRVVITTASKGQRYRYRFPTTALREIVYGCRCDERTRSEVRRWLSAGGLHPVEYQATPSPTTFSLQIARIQ